ncbi:acyltransferase family protein, partial [Phocaeicola vulgatus]|nr:acyltransferase family protein [Phocaeicola vulgatus]
MTQYLSDKFKVLSLISIILVLYIHSGFHDYPNEIQGMVFNANLQSFISGMIGRCAVPLFYAISGYLFFTGLYDGGNANYQKLWFKIKKRGKTLLVPYIIACLFPVVFNLVLEFIPGIE